MPFITNAYMVKAQYVRLLAAAEPESGLDADMVICKKLRDNVKSSLCNLSCHQLIQTCYRALNRLQLTCFMHFTLSADGFQ